jgi:hypothetical protein
MSITKVLAAVALATTGALGAAGAQARDANVQWSVTIGSPFYVPAPVYVRPAPIYVPPAPVYWQRGYHEPRRWDRDGDGIPNRYDRLYNPRWDRDGDGIPNRYDRHPDGRHGWGGGHDGRGGYDGRGRDNWGGGHGGGRGGNDGRGGRGY